MKKYSSKEIRKIWLDFFASKNHKIIESKSLIPKNDPSILWINSGVATLKKYFSGKELPLSPRMVNSQKCIRTNDIENVGITARHHTFFEMLGSFSIGDYFKDKAIKIAFELIFKVFAFPKEKIYVSYFEKDKFTYNKWLSLGIDAKNLIKGTKKTNFWDLGQGPCGPCTEIFFDRGQKFDPKNLGVELLEKDIENDRYIEIWNIVFSQFNNDGENNYEELKQKNIDTGAGLERIACIFQDVPTNFDTDLFLPIINEIEKITNKKYSVENYFIKDQNQSKINKKMRIIADHLRAIVLAINDGAKPSNTRRGYIIRRLIRRSYRCGIELGIKNKIFLSKLVSITSFVIDYYKIDQEKVQAIIKKEELAFSNTIKQGEKILHEEINKNKTYFSPQIAFKLFETYGFPIELTKEILSEKNIKLDISMFNKLMKEHGIKSKNKQNVGIDKQIQSIQVVNKKVSKFIGYEVISSISEVIKQVFENDKYFVLLDKTPFYATKGGQLHDWGKIDNIPVLDVFQDKYNNHWHVLNKKIHKKEVAAVVDRNLRIKKARNHSSTHLLGLALTKVFGKNTLQLGSYNDENKLRLDFNLDNKPTNQELKKVEIIVNNLIKKSIERKYKLMKYDDAIEHGVLALENEDYGEGLLRVVEFDESKEFCGGTHIRNTSLIEKFKISKIDSKGSGVYRIEAITSNKEIKKFESKAKKSIIFLIEQKIKKLKKINPSYSIKYSILNTLGQLKNTLEKLILEIKKIKNSNYKKVNFDLENINFQNWNKIKTHINLNVDVIENIKPLAIKLRDNFEDALFIVGKTVNEKTMLAIASKIVDAKELFSKIASSFNGKGGGNKTFAMGSTSKIISLKDFKWEK